MSSVSFIFPSSHPDERRVQLPSQLWRQRAEVFFQQLDVYVERAERVADFMCQPAQQPRQQIPLFRRGQLRRILAEGFC